MDGNFRYVWLGRRWGYGGGVIATTGFGCRHGCLVFCVQNLCFGSVKKSRRTSRSNAEMFDVTECDQLHHASTQKTD